MDLHAPQMNATRRLKPGQGYPDAVIASRAPYFVSYHGEPSRFSPGFEPFRSSKSYDGFTPLLLNRHSLHPLS